MATELVRVSGGLKAIVRNEIVLTTAYTNSSITASDVMSLFTPAASGIYVIEASLWVQSAATTTGIQLGVVGPSSGVTTAGVRVSTASAAGTEMVSHMGLNTYQAAVAGLAAPNLAELDALIQQGTSAATTAVSISAKSEVAASAVTVLAGSSIEWRRIA